MKKKKGLSLLELMLGVSLISVVTLALSQIYITAVTVREKTLAMNQVQMGVDASLQHINYMIDTATSITSPTPSNNQSSLVLVNGGVTYTYEVQAGILTETSTNGTIPLHIYEIEITDLVFENKGTVDNDSIRVNLDATYRPNSRQTLKYKLNFDKTL